jgi:hypothetical protein
LDDASRRTKKVTSPEMGGTNHEVVKEVDCLPHVEGVANADSSSDPSTVPLAGHEYSAPRSDA